MKTFEQRTFQGVSQYNSRRTLTDLECRTCSFVGCDVTWTKGPEQRPLVRNVRLIDCEVRGCALEGVILEDVLIDGLQTHTMLQVFGTVYKHVTLRGTIGSVMLNHLIDLDDWTSPRQRAFDAANAAYYATIDWALDIQAAEFTSDPDIRGVPARLIHRDPATQVVITRTKALDGRWRQLGLEQHTHWPTALEFFLDQGHPDVVLVAPKRSPDYLELLAGLQTLRAAGIAEPE